MKSPLNTLSKIFVRLGDEDEQQAAIAFRRFRRVIVTKRLRTVDYTLVEANGRMELDRYIALLNRMKTPSSAKIAELEQTIERQSETIRQLNQEIAALKKAPRSAKQKP